MASEHRWYPVFAPYRAHPSNPCRRAGHRHPAGEHRRGRARYYSHRTGNVFHPNAPFVPEAPAKLPAKRIARTAWPMYGFTANHARAFPAGAALRPPFHVVWAHKGRVLLEFPPALYGNSIFQLADDGVLLALDKDTGRPLWSRDLGALSASSPAVADNTVFATICSGAPA